MNDIDRLSENVKLGKMGQLVTHNEAFKTAVATIREELFNTFANSKQDEHEKREEAWRSMQNLNRLLTHFENLLFTAKISEGQLEELEHLRK